MYESPEGIAHYATMLTESWGTIHDSDDACKDYYALLLEMTAEFERSLRICEHLAEKALSRQTIPDSGVTLWETANESGDPITPDEEMATLFLNEFAMGDLDEARETFAIVHVDGGQEAMVRFLNLLVNFYGETT